MKRRAAAPILVRLAPVALAGCAAPDWSTIQPVSDFGRMLLDVYVDVWWWSLGIFVVVEGLLLFALWRYRHRAGDPDVPEQVHGHSLVEIGWTLAPALILFFIAIPTVKTIFLTQGPPPQDDPLEVRVVGHQWWWEFDYPDLGVRTANEPHFPRGRTVRLVLTSADVIHSFWVPRLGGKRDLNPGSENVLWFTPDSAGVYEGQCAELCGTSHANMRMRAFVDEPAAFERWVASLRGPGTAPATADTAPGAADTVGAAATATDLAASAAPVDSAGFQAFLVSGCAACHAIAGTPAQGRIGPDLSNVGSRTTIAAGMLENTPANMTAWLRSPDSVKPGALMPDLNLTEDRLRTLVAFLQGLR